MMSLFSPFDMMLYAKSSLVFMIVAASCCAKSYVLDGFSNSKSKGVLSLSSFFYSLKPKSFNKFSEMMFMIIILSLCYMNFFSVFSYNFPFSSQVSVMMFLALGVWLSMILFSIYTSFNKFLYHFIPEGTPLPLTFLLFLIELVSSSIRPITLTVRLVANILAGHLLMILLSGLVLNFYLVFPLYLLLNLVEVFVSLIQAYIFSTMMVLYFSEL